MIYSPKLINSVILNVVYFRLKPLDIEFMKRLHEKVNIIPLIAKADTLTPEECQQFKKQVSKRSLNSGFLYHLCILQFFQFTVLQCISLATLLCGHLYCIKNNSWKKKPLKIICFSFLRALIHYHYHSTLILCQFKIRLF